MDAYIVFYQTPAGQHLLDLQPQILKELMPVVMRRVRKDVQGIAESQTKELLDFIEFCKAPSSAPAN